MPAAIENSSVPTDRELARSFLAGDEAAFERLVQRHQEKVLRVCRRYAGDEATAWDLWQEAFMRLHGSLARWTEGESVAPWLMRIAVNVGRDAARRRRSWARRFRPFGQGEESAVPARPEPPPPADPRTGEALRRALAELPRMQKEALILRFFGELPVRDVAAALEMSESSAKTHMARGLARLRSKVRLDG